MNDGALSKPKILIVDDNPENIRILLSLEDHYDLMYALSGEEALESIFSGEQPELILLDVMMPGMDGYEVCKKLKSNINTRDIPIIFVTAMSQVEDETKGLELGAVDYISKPFSMAIVRGRISTALRLKEEMSRRIMLTRQLQEMNQHLESRVSRKVAELSQVHEDLKESEKRLFQAQKMEAMGTLAGGIAHDFNNILFSMMGYCEMTFRSLPTESKEYGYMEKVLKAGRRAGELIKQILSFSRQTEKERKILRIKFIVKEVTKLMGSAFPPSIEIEENIQSKSRIFADPVEIHQVVMNLCTNALHAMQGDKKGILRISLTDTEGPYCRIQEMDIIHTPCVRLEVTDTGCGMPPETAERIFEPYFTTKSKGKGTGLGLATTYRIVKDLNGHISVKSEIGKGSSFFVDFPRMEKIEKIVKSNIAAKVLPKGRERILLLDDEETICDMLARILETLGYHVSAHTSALEALTSFKAAPDKFDIIIADMIMPDLTGSEVAEQVIKVRPDIPMIIITGSTNPSEIKKVKNLGVHEILMKPVLQEDIAGAIKRELSPSRK